MSSILDVGVAGVGWVAERSHLPAYDSDPRTNVRAIAELESKKRSNIATKYSIPETYVNAKEMLQQENLDILSICTPPHTHESIFLTAAESGCDIYCEKPLATTSDEGDRMLNSARKNGTIVQVGYIYQYHPNFRKARRLIKNNILQDITQINVVFSTSGPPNRDWRFDADKNTHGVVGEITTHLLDFYFSIFREPPNIVSADLSSTKYDVTDESHIRLKWGNTRLNLVTNWTQSGDRVHNHFVFGKNGWLEITDDFLRGNLNGESLNFKYGKPPTFDISSTDGKLFDAFLQKDEINIQTDRIIDFIDHVIDGNPETAAPISRGVEITRTVEEIYEKE